ncbi:MAG TPA: DUF58 domain-containing protein [Candidatus Limnocylindrales bacterium]|nr:DUF58 domain-containing protein [Candidatus Limnocylindrales bacterium]
MPGAITLWLLLVWYGATSAVSWLFLLAGWMVALIAAAAAYALWNRAGLRLDMQVRASTPGPDSPAAELPEQLLRTAPARTLFEGDGAEVEVGLETSGAGRGPAWVAGRIGDEEVTLATGLVPRKGWRSTHAVPSLRRGVLGATGWTIGSSDPLGFFQGKRRCPDSEVALVLPRFASLARQRLVRELETAVTSPRAGSGNELFGIREYRPGDSLRRIHWRSSARRGELVVREYEPPGVQTVGIVLDPSPPNVEVADQIARIAASEAWDCLRDGGRVEIWAPGFEPTDSPRDLWGLLEWLARYPDCPPGPAAIDMSTAVAITADPQLLELGAVRRWLVGDAEVEGEIEFERVGTAWPL